jgi:hypothetical protein
MGFFNTIDLVRTLAESGSMDPVTLARPLVEFVL